MNLTARSNCPLSHMAMTSMKSVMLEEEGKSAGAETNMPAEVADNRRNNPPARLRQDTERKEQRRFVNGCQGYGQIA